MIKPLKIVLMIAAGMLLLVCVSLLPLGNGRIWAMVVSYYHRFGDREWVVGLLKSFGWAAPAVFILIQAGQVVLAPIPGDVTGFLGGYVFGAWSGFLLSTIGLTIGSMAAFYLARIIEERFAGRITSNETFRKYNDLVRSKGLLVIFILFLLPGFPKDYLCLFLGLTDLPGSVFFALSTIGRMPGTLALSFQGASVFGRHYVAFAIITAMCVMLAVVAYLTRDPLHRWMHRQTKTDSTTS